MSRRNIKEWFVGFKDAMFVYDILNDIDEFEKTYPEQKLAIERIKKTKTRLKEIISNMTMNEHDKYEVMKFRTIIAELRERERRNKLKANKDFAGFICDVLF